MVLRVWRLYKTGLRRSLIKYQVHQISYVFFVGRSWSSIGIVIELNRRFIYANYIFSYYWRGKNTIFGNSFNVTSSGTTSFTKRRYVSTIFTWKCNFGRRFEIRHKYCSMVSPALIFLKMFSKLVPGPIRQVYSILVLMSIL